MLFDPLVIYLLLEQSAGDLLPLIGGATCDEVRDLERSLIDLGGEAARRILLITLVSVLHTTCMHIPFVLFLSLRMQ